MIDIVVWGALIIPVVVIGLFVFGVLTFDSLKDLDGAIRHRRYLRVSQGEGGMWRWYSYVRAGGREYHIASGPVRGFSQRENCIESARHELRGYIIIVDNDEEESE